MRELLRDADESATETPRDRALGTLCVVGNIPEYLDPDGLFAFLAHDVPTVMLQHTRRLIFKRFYHDEELFRVKEVIQRDRFIGGTYTPVLKVAQANIKRERIETPERLRCVVAHELGHGLMMTGLYWSELSDFNAARHQEPVHVSEYVTWVAEKLPGSLLGEDFAETIALLLTEPDHLQAIAPLRHEAMTQILAAHA